jgi:hypothetical protein
MFDPQTSPTFPLRPCGMKPTVPGGPLHVTQWGLAGSCEGENGRKAVYKALFPRGLSLNHNFLATVRLSGNPQV